MSIKGRYHRYSEAMTQRYGMKIYKIPLNLKTTCPNRDGVLSHGGCSFCGDVGAGFECREDTMPLAEQYRVNSEYIGRKYKAQGFIAYLQNFSNTYMPVAQFNDHLAELEQLGVLGVSIATRPDCVSDEHLAALKAAADRNRWHVTLEYGLQTLNYHTLYRVNRGHGLAEFIDAVIRTHRFGFEVCAHMILNLPGDADIDAIEGASVLSALGVEQVKLHGLYVLKGTPLGEAFEKNELTMISAEAYVERVVSFIRHASPDMVFQRLAGRAPESETLFCNWGMSWWKVADMIEKRLDALDAYQGDRCNRLGGSAVKHYSCES